MAQVFEGLRVLDFSHGMAGAIATMIMADYGAEVIKVEPPTGDPSRAQPAYRQWQRGKKSVVLDLKTPAGQCDAQRLGANSDVLLESFRPGKAEQLGIDYPRLAAVNPGLVYCSITGFGEKGPYARFQGYDAVVQAKSGRMMDYQGIAARDGPTFTAQPVAAYAAAQFAAQGIIAALYVRARTGCGQRVSTSLLNSIGVYELRKFLAAQLHDRFPAVFPPPDSPGSSGSSLVSMAAVTKDGRWLHFSNRVPRMFRAFVRAIELEDVFEAAGVMDSPLKLATADLWELVLTRIHEKTHDEWMAAFMPDDNIAVEPYRDMQAALDHPQMVHNGHVVDVADPEVGPTNQIGPLVSLSETPASIQGPAPALGQHTREVLAALDRGRQPVMEPRSELPKHALEGVTVLELGGYWAGPYATSLLADLGARVIKVEPLDGDPWRAIDMEIKTVQGKESLALDLKTAAGKTVFYALVERADLLLHNFRPDVPARLGFDYATLRKINPRLIYLFQAAYGSTGPYALRPAFFTTIGAASGEGLYQAGQDTPPAPGTPLTIDDVKRISRHLGRSNMNSDANAAMGAGTALLMGLYARARTGQGQYLECTMLGSNAYANSEGTIRYAGKPAQRQPDVELYGLGPLYRLYRCREGWIFLACPAEKEWVRLCQALDREELLADGRFATTSARSKHEAALSTLLEQTFQEQTAAQWEDSLTRQDIACVVADAGEYYRFFCDDTHMAANDMTVEVVHPVYGPHRRHAPGVTLSRTPGIAGPSASLGEHTQKILGELGYSPDQMASLKEEKVVTWPN